MRSARRWAPRPWMCWPAPRKPRCDSARATGSRAPGLVSRTSVIGCFMRRRALTRPSWRARERSWSLIRFPKSKSPGSWAAGLCTPRGLRPYLGTDTVQPGLGNRVQSMVEMNREDIAGISDLRALSWAPSARTRMMRALANARKPGARTALSRANAHGAAALRTGSSSRASGSGRPPPPDAATGCSAHHPTTRRRPWSPTRRRQRVRGGRTRWSPPPAGSDPG